MWAERAGLFLLSITLTCLDQASAAGAAQPSRASGVSPAGRESLDYAFRFASAIKTDEKDRSQAQQAVVLDYASLGDWDQAIRWAGEVAGWRQGTVYADLATALAREGRTRDARSLVDKAEQVRAGITGWQARRIDAHVAQALASLGDLDASKRISSRLVSDDAQQYAGRAAATEASGYAARGEFDQAMERLGTVDSASDDEVAWWRTAGYLALARKKELPRARRLEAIGMARSSAASISGWKRAEALESIADDLVELGETNTAREVLETATGIVQPLPATTPVKAPLLSNLSRAWSRAGEPGRARSLLAEALAVLPSAPLIDRPGVYANIASSHLAAGDIEEARSLYDHALEAAAGLLNARPRALAVVDICRSMGRQGLALDEEQRARLDRLYGGLGDPW